MSEYALLSKYQIDGEGTENVSGTETRLVKRRYNLFTWLFAARCWKCHSPVTHDVYEITKDEFLNSQCYGAVARVCEPCDLVMFYELDCCN